MTIEELQEKAKMVEQEDDELEKRRMPVDNMRPGAAKRVPEKNKLCAGYEKNALRRDHRQTLNTEITAPSRRCH